MRLIHKNQKGFTLIEVLIVVAIMAGIAVAANGVIVQLVQSNRISNHMVAIRQVQQAGYYVSKDGLQAQNISGRLTTSSSLHLNWTDWDGQSYNITYTMEPMGTLYRLHRNGVPLPIEYLTENTECRWNATGKEVLIFNITAMVGLETESRTYEIKPRTFI